MSDYDFEILADVLNSLRARSPNEQARGLAALNRIQESATAPDPGDLHDEAYVNGLLEKIKALQEQQQETVDLIPNDGVHGFAALEAAQNRIAALEDEHEDALRTIERLESRGITGMQERIARLEERVSELYAERAYMRVASADDLDWEDLPKDNADSWRAHVGPDVAREMEEL
jgi:hypothetical protein